MCLVAGALLDCLFDGEVVWTVPHHAEFGDKGRYRRGIAETKASLVMDYAKEHGQPLKCTAEPEGFGGSDE